MSEGDGERRVAVYIDAENVGMVHAPAILARASQLGRLTLLRCHGNAAALAGWTEAMRQHAITPVLTPQLDNQKNASDFALVIDAVAQANRDTFDLMLLASSDGDFQLLAMHLRELGIACHSVCESKAADLPRSAFSSTTALSQRQPPGTPQPKPVPCDDFSAFRTAALDLLREENPMPLSTFGKAMKSRLGARYPAGKLSKRLRQYPGDFKVDAHAVRRQG